MKTAIVTGAAGFIGRNLLARLEAENGVRPLGVTRADTTETLAGKLRECDIVYHLAGSNRPEHPAELFEVNVEFTREVLAALAHERRAPPVVLASSTQAERDNDYGRSKRQAEELLEDYARERGGAAIIYRLTNVFGKWARPDYNSVVATFCHAIARDRPIDVHDPGAPLRLVHVDDVVTGLMSHLEGPPEPVIHRPDAGPVFETTVGEIAGHLRAFRAGRETLLLPDMSDPFLRRLYSTYVSYLPDDALAYDLLERIDDRGRLAELLKSEHVGQVFVSTTRPGVTRGHHFHHGKAEKFLVLRGEALIRFRPPDGGSVLEVPVSGTRFRVVDIPPGHAHSIENVGDEEMIVLFWANEVFDPDRPDTVPREVQA